MVIFHSYTQQFRKALKIGSWGRGSWANRYEESLKIHVCVYKRLSSTQFTLQMISTCPTTKAQAPWGLPTITPLVDDADWNNQSVTQDVFLISEHSNTVGNPGCHKPTIWGSCTTHKNGHLGMVYSLGFPLPIAVDKPLPPLLAAWDQNWWIVWFAQKKWVRKDNSVSSENVNLLCSN